MIEKESIMSPKTIYITRNMLVWLTKQDKANDTKLNGPKETVCIYQCPWEIEGFLFFKHIWLRTPSVPWIKRSTHIKKKKKIPICKRVEFSCNHFFYNTYTAWILEHLYLKFYLHHIRSKSTTLMGATVLQRSQRFSCFHRLSFHLEYVCLNGLFEIEFLNSQ